MASESSSFSGQLVAICLADDKCADLQSVAEAEAIAGKGLAGDRYFRQVGTYSKGGIAPDREVTLIEIEALHALQRECSLTVAPEKARRNLVTRGVPLNHLVGREFAVGAVVLRGLRLCEPCGHLEKLTVTGINAGLVHRGGLRAQVIVGGVLRVGDPIGPRSAHQ